MPAEEPQLSKVLFVAPAMEARGTNEYVLYMASELKRRGIQVMVFCGPGPMTELLGARGIPAETFEGLGPGRLRRAERKRLAEQMADFSAEIAHAQTPRLAGCLLNLPQEVAVPVVLTVHGPSARKKTMRAVASKVAGIIATTQDVREELVNSFKIEKAKIQFVPNGIDVEALAARQIRPVFSQPTAVVGSMGPVEHAKGHQMFVRAAAELAGDHDELRFVVAGEGNELPRLRRLAEELQLAGRLTFVGDFSSYGEVLEALDVVVQSAQVDVSGFSILDAMGHGRPVIAFNTGTACEIIDEGKTGLLVPRDEMNALKRAIESLVDDPEAARRMGRRARETVAEKFNIRKVGETTLGFYARCLSPG